MALLLSYTIAIKAMTQMASIKKAYMIMFLAWLILPCPRADPTKADIA